MTRKGQIYKILAEFFGKNEAEYISAVSSSSCKQRNKNTKE
jgi:hypothetical protein